LLYGADVPGVMRDKDDISTIISQMNIAETRALIKEEVIYGGMIPKVQCCVAALAQGVKAAHIIDGRQPHSLLTEVMSEEGSGTMIVG
jgi:acetylglutamate kinase